MGFRPQPDIEKSLIFVDENAEHYENNSYIKNLNQYLDVCMYTIE